MKRESSLTVPDKRERIKYTQFIMLNRRLSSLERTTSNGGGAGGGSDVVLSSSPQFLYSRSISTPSPSLPKAIPFPHGIRSKSVLGHGINLDGSLPPCSAPVTFNRYINVNCNANVTPEQGSSPTSWYARLSSSLKKSVLRRSISNRESTKKLRVNGIQRRSVICLLLFSILV